MANEAPKFLNCYGYSDVTPYEVVRVVSDTCVEIREMVAERDPTWKPEFIVGGFSAHCVNQNTQRWIIASNPNGNVLRIRLSKKGWGKGAYRVSDKPIKFYDYNF